MSKFNFRRIIAGILVGILLSEGMFTQNLMAQDLELDRGHLEVTPQVPLRNLIEEEITGEGDNTAPSSITQETEDDNPFQGITVAVLDSGYTGEQEERILDSQANFSDSGKDGVTMDDNGHGSAMADIILEHSGENVRVIPIKVLNHKGRGTVESVAKGIEKALELSVDMINLSVDSEQILGSQRIQSLFQKAKSQQVLIFVAVGNQSLNMEAFTIEKPENVLLIGALDQKMEKAGYSNYGKGIDFCALGQIEVENYFGREIYTGTSVATSLCAAVAAKYEKNISCGEKIQRLRQEAVDLGEAGYDSFYGYGCLYYEQIHKKEAVSDENDYMAVVSREEPKVADLGEFTGWRQLSDEELNHRIQESSEQEVAAFVKALTKGEREEIFLRDTDLNKTVQEVTFDEKGYFLSERTYVFMEYLLTESIHAQSLTVFGSKTGYFYAKYSEDGQIQGKRTKITIEVNNITPWVAMTEKPTYTLKSSNVEVFKISQNQTETLPDANGDYYCIRTNLIRTNVPAHYYPVSWEDNHSLSDHSDIIDLDKVTTGHSSTTYDCEFVLKVDTNGCGLTWWGPEQANGVDYSRQYEKTALHNEVVIDFSKFSEELYIDPNGGSYTYTTGGETVSKKSKFLLATKKCEASIGIKTPKRVGYQFNGWKLIRKNGGSGQYDSSEKKYYFCGKKKNSATTLEAKWTKNTPTPKPTATSTPKPTATSTPKPTATSTPKPTATSMPKPTANSTPPPTLTSTPPPEATSTPTPTATNTPTPTPTKIPSYYLTYLRNEPSGIERLHGSGFGVEETEHLVMKQGGNLRDVQAQMGVEFVGWCVAKGEYDPVNHTLTNLYWIDSQGRKETAVAADENGRWKVSDATGEVVTNQAELSRIEKYVFRDGESIVLIGKWEVNVYTLRYIKNNENCSTKEQLTWVSREETDFTYTGEVTLEGKICMAGYEFMGWNTKVDGTGESFAGEQENKFTGKDFLLRAGINPQDNHSIIELYAVWKPKTYTLTFCTNEPTKENNTHEASHKVEMQNGKISFVWDEKITNGNIGGVSLPTATLIGWHPRFQAGLWYTGAHYQKQGKAIKNGTVLGLDTFNTVGDQTVYAQWEANTYLVTYSGNGETEKNRGIVSGQMKEQKLTYDKKELLNANEYTKKDKNFAHHDEENLEENSYGLKYNNTAATDFQYAYLGWSLHPYKEGVDFIKQEDFISKEMAKTEGAWNFTEENGGNVTLYACWNGIPNITLAKKEHHFVRYEDAKVSMEDFMALVKAYDLEEGDITSSLTVESIRYYFEGQDSGEVEREMKPENKKEPLNTSLEGEGKKSGGYRKFQIVFHVKDGYEMFPYFEETVPKEVSFTGKVLYNEVPAIFGYKGEENLKERYLYLEGIQQESKEAFQEALLLQIITKDVEDESYRLQKDSLEYQGRIHPEPVIQVTNLQNLYEEIKGEENWTQGESEDGKRLTYEVTYEDIFGKTTKKEGVLYVVSAKRDQAMTANRQQRYVRFISKEYLDTLDESSGWREGEKKKMLQKSLEESNHSIASYEIP